MGFFCITAFLLFGGVVPFWRHGAIGVAGCYVGGKFVLQFDVVTMRSLSNGLWFWWWMESISPAYGTPFFLSGS